MVGLSVAQGVLGVSCYVHGGQYRESGGQERLQTRSHRVSRVEQVVDLQTVWTGYDALNT